MTTPPVYRRPALLIALAGALLAAILLVNLIPFLRGGFNWQWPYRLAPSSLAALLVGLTVIYLVGVWRLLRAERPMPLLLWSALGVVVLTLAVMRLREDNLLYALFARTVSGVTTGPHFAAAEVDWSGAGLYDWPTVMHTFDGRSGHVSVSPPGLPMFYGLLNDLFGRLSPALLSPLHQTLLPYQCHNYRFLAYTPGQWASAWFGILMPLWASLAVFPLYAVARRTGGDRVGRLAAAWWPLVPALVAFSPTWSTVYPLFSLGAFWLFDRGLHARPGLGWITAAGALTGLMIFANFAFVPFVGLFAFYTLAVVFLGERRRLADGLRRAVTVGLSFGLGLVIPWALYWLASGLTFFDVFFASMDLHLDLDRPYLPWVWLHFWDWTLWTGLVMILLWAAGIVHWLRVGRRRGDNPPLLAIALALMIAVLDFSGTARGESGRVWLVYTPFAVVAAADGMRRLTGSENGKTERGTSAAAAVTLAQTAVMLVIVITLDVINAPDLFERPPAPGALQQVGTLNPAGVRFPGFDLNAWSAESDGNSITLALNWQARETVTTPYWFSALPVSPDGQPVGSAVVWQPLQTRYPTTCWRPGEQIGEQITLALPDDAAPGAWWISLTAFDDDTGQHRLPVTLVDGTQDTQVGLGPVIVP